MEGLPSSRVRSIVQDGDGRMWIATRQGVAIYDGASWEVHGLGHGLESEDLRWITIDQHGEKWVLCRGRFLRWARWNGEVWVHQPQHSTPTAEASGLEVDAPTGQAFVGCAGGLMRFDGEAWSRVHGSDQPVLALELAGRRLYAGDTGGLFQLDLDHPEQGLARVPGVEGAIWGLHAVSGGVQVVSSDGIGLLESGAYRGLAEHLDFSRFRLSPSMVSTLAIEPDGVGGLFLGSPHAVLWWNPDGGQVWVGAEQGLSSTGAWDLFRDREGNIWVAGSRGVSKIVGRGFESLGSETGLYRDEVTAIDRLPSGEVVLGHPGGLSYLSGTSRLERKSIRIEELEGGEMRGRVMGLEVGRDGTLFVARAEAGVLAIQPDGQRKNFPFRVLGGVLLEGDTLHVGGIGELGRIRLEDGEWSRIDPLPVSIPGLVRNVAPCRDGSLLVGVATNGVVRIHPDGAREHFKSGILARESVFAVHERPDGSVWAGTEEGLMEALDGRLVPVVHPEISRSVYFILRDLDGASWFGTDGGVACWREETDELQWFAPPILSGFETNRDAGMVDHMGRVWVGTDRGLSIFDPDVPRFEGSGPTLEFLEIVAGDTSVPVSEAPPTLEATGRTLSFVFRAISFLDERHVSFRHWLEGFDEGWSDPEVLNHREIRYVSLPPGRYRLHIEAIDVNHRTSPRVVSPWVEIPRPLYQNPLFLGSAAVLVVGFIWVIVARSNARSYAKRLEREVEQRSGQLADSRRELAADRERLSVVLASINEGVAAIDSRGRVFLWNHAAAHLTGRSSGDALGCDFVEALGVPDDHELRGKLAVLLEGRPSHAEVVTFEGADRERILEISGAPLLGGLPEIQGAVIAFRDVAKRREWERDVASAQRLEALGLLAGGIAHDFNNYLTVILGTLGLIAEDRSVPRLVRERVRMAEETLNRAVSLTQQLLTFSKGGAPICKPVSLEELVRETARFALSGSAVCSEVEVESGLRRAEVDEGQIAEVLHNLILNARQVMPEGGVIHMSLRNRKEAPHGLAEGPYVEISVRDEGPGIAAEDLPHVFDPFFTRREGGTGLGLAVAHSVVQRHGGRITVDSPVGQGTNFRILLPSTGEQVDVVTEPRPVEHEAEGVRILLMDDEPGIRRVLTAMLRHLGYAADAVEEGEQAIAKYRTAMERALPYHVVILDLTIRGGLGGLDTLERLLSLDPTARVIAATGYSAEGVIGDCQRYGFRAALAKPFKLRELEATLSEVLSESSAPLT